MAGMSHCLAALWHERKPQMFFHVLDNYFLNLRLPFAFFPPTAESKASSTLVFLCRELKHRVNPEFETCLRGTRNVFNSTCLESFGL